MIRSGCLPASMLRRSRGFGTPTRFEPSAVAAWKVNRLPRWKRLHARSGNPCSSSPWIRTLRGLLLDGSSVVGTKQGRVQLAQDVLDLTQGGHLTFAHREIFDLEQPLSLECWVWINQLGPASVLASCGVWQQSGWFLQQIGGQWRWHVGGQDCDGGQVTAGRWTHLVGVYDGRTSRLYQDGVKAGERPGPFTVNPWPGELHIGQYSGQVAPEYQLHGRIAGLKIYHRALSSAEIVAASKAPPR